jgi:hypothetical protein
MPRGRVNRDGDGDPLGVAVFLSTSELRELGVDLDSERVRFRVENGSLVAEEEGGS